MTVIQKIIEDTKAYFSDSRGSHDREHTQRVHKLCLHIGKKENADMDVLEIAAILHDIGRKHQDLSNGEICHAEKGAELARELLSKYNFDFNKIDQIVHCIETHRFRGTKIPNSKEAKILYDADKLDSIGAVGIGRSFLFAGEIGAKLHNKDVDINQTKEYSKDDTAYREYMVKLRKIKDKMLTQEGKNIAEERHNFMVDFFERLNKEVDGLL
ncbi:MAG: HD domain-containing protein [Candidatus Absconditabacteria bacterium]|nr:HD domain-containing protein [Candidatus Absconditabacteria bacterium]